MAGLIGCDQGLHRRERGLQAGEAILRQRQPDIALEAELDGVLRALENFRRRDRFVLFVQALRIEKLIAEIQQFLAFLRTRNIRRGPQHHRNQAARFACVPTGLSTTGRGDQAITRRFGVSGFQTIDRWIEPQQAIAIGLRDLVMRKFFFLVVTDFRRKIADQGIRQHRQILRG